jgi:hypothetical protein
VREKRLREVAGGRKRQIGHPRREPRKGPALQSRVGAAGRPWRRRIGGGQPDAWARPRGRRFRVGRVSGRSRVGRVCGRSAMAIFSGFYYS